MRIESLSFSEFRNYERFSLEGIGDLTVLVGRNGVGKTNVLEGIQLLTSASSFRHPQVAQLVREGAECGRVALEAGDGLRALSVALALAPGSRRYSVNGKAKSGADVRGLLPSVIFTPDDLQLAKGSSGVKRSALDDLGMQLTRNYYVVRRDYEKTVRYKNRLLRDEAPRDLIESINETLVTCGAQLFCLRAALFERMVPVVARVYSELSSDAETFSAELVPSWARLGGQQPRRLLSCFANFERKTVGSGTTTYEVVVLPGSVALQPPEAREVLAAELERWYDEERRRGRALIGPHADEVTFALAGRDAAAFASQGQQRSIVLAWKMAEVETVRSVLGVQPVLLLDDVLSELDGSRREMLVRFVTEDVQTFVTATDLNGFSDELIDRAKVVKLPL